MNEPPGARARVALTGLTVAEYFRDQEGQDVLLFIDNIFRFTQAGSEVCKAWVMSTNRNAFSKNMDLKWLGLVVELNEIPVSNGLFVLIFVPCTAFFVKLQAYYGHHLLPFQVSALLGRIPSAVGYQPTLATDMGTMQERITTTKKGSITSVQVWFD